MFGLRTGHSGELQHPTWRFRDDAFAQRTMTEPTHVNLNALGHEPIATDVRAVWKTAAVMVGVVIVSFALIFGMMRWFWKTEGGRTAGQAAKADSDYGDLPPLQRLRIRESQILGEYEWMDKEAPAARIPIERAMEIVAEHGVSARFEQPQTTTPPNGGQPSETQETTAENGSAQE